MIEWLLDRARDYNLAFQVHTGLARLSGSSPLLLMPLVERHPHVTFDLFHGGYPWIHESGAMLQNYPNVRLNITWLPQLSTEAAVGALKEWIQVAPQVDRITWGADCRTVEESHGATLATRHVVARALSELVRDGYLDEDEAEPLGRSILLDSGRDIYGIDLSATDGS
jgi:predicted TIM-barrel fold metal-dependent hydrolase